MLDLNTAVLFPGRNVRQLTIANTITNIIFIIRDEKESCNLSGMHALTGEVTLAKLFPLFLKRDLLRKALACRKANRKLQRCLTCEV